MRVVGVNGSGRVGGNTSVLVRAVLDGAAEAGAETSLLELGEMTIAGCDSCNACKKKHCCVVADDMSRFYEVLPETDVLVLGSPIYFDHITAQLKAFLDRLYCYRGADASNLYPRRDVRAVLAITYEANNPEMYDYVLDWLERRLKGNYDIVTVGTFKVNRTQFDPLIELAHPEVQRAHELGRTLKA